MLRLRKKEAKDGRVNYYYQKEGRGEWGELIYFIDSDLCRCVKLSEGDRENDEKYRDHAFCRMMKYVQENNYPETDLVAWG